MRDERARMIARSPKSSPPPDMRRPMIAFAALLLRAAAASASPQPQAPPLVIGPVFGQDYGGADYATVFLNSSLDRSTDHFKAVAEECLARCVTDARCCAWTYCLPHSATEPGPERCCLKSSVPPLNSKNGCGWTGLAPRAVGLNNTVSSLCGGGTRPPVPPSPPPSTFNSTAQFHPRTAAGGTQDASGVIQTADGRWHIFPDCHPLHDPAQTNNKSFLPPRGYGGMGWAHLSSDDLVTWIDHGMAMQPGRARTGGYVPFDENYDNMLMDTVRVVTFSFLCPLLEKYGTFIVRCNALIEKVSSFRGPCPRCQMDLCSQLYLRSTKRHSLVHTMEISLVHLRRIRSYLGSRSLAQ
eukprot:SAG31_NODE_1978_length_6749_cov_5.971579_4_plen_354_part_00